MRTHFAAMSAMAVSTHACGSLYQLDHGATLVRLRGQFCNHFFCLMVLKKSINFFCGVKEIVHR